MGFSKPTFYELNTGAFNEKICGIKRHRFSFPLIFLFNKYRCREREGTNCEVTKEVGMKMCEALEHFDKVRNSNIVDK